MPAAVPSSNLLLGGFPFGASVVEADNWVCAEAERLSLAVDVVVVAPEFPAARRDEDIEPTTVAELERFRCGFLIGDVSRIQLHLRYPLASNGPDTVADTVNGVTDGSRSSLAADRLKREKAPIYKDWKSIWGLVSTTPKKVTGAQKRIWKSTLKKACKIWAF